MCFNLFGYDFTLSELIALGCSLFLTAFYAVKTHGLKNIIKEVLSMMYKFKTYESVDPLKSKGQTFDKFAPVYRLNKATGELEETDEVVDVQAVVDSCLETALDRSLDRLLPKVETAEDVAELDLMREDLDEAMNVCNLAEEYKKSLKLDDKLSVEEVFSEVAKKAELLKARIDTVKALKEAKDNEKTENVEKGE